jgi:hypothetical protein
MESVSDILLKVFQQYCSFGEPLNTDKLKSGKFVKLFTDLELVSDALTPYLGDDTTSNATPGKSVTKRSATP